MNCFPFCPFHGEGMGEREEIDSFVRTSRAYFTIALLMPLLKQTLIRRKEKVKSLAIL